MKNDLSPLSQNFRGEKIQLNQIIKYPLLFQIIIGVVCALLNLALCSIQDYYPIPLFMDTVFTVTASLFGAVSGLIAAFLFHLFSMLVHSNPPSDLTWSICSLTVVLVIRLYLRKRNIKQTKLDFFDVLLLLIIIAIIISIEGAIIFTILRALVEYRETAQVRTFYLYLLRFDIPVFLSAFIPRIPVNLLDKGICVTLGLFIYKGLCKIKWLQILESRPL